MFNWIRNKLHRKEKKAVSAAPSRASASAPYDDTSSNLLLMQAAQDSDQSRREMPAPRCEPVESRSSRSDSHCASSSWGSSDSSSSSSCDSGGSSSDSGSSCGGD